MTVYLKEWDFNRIKGLLTQLQTQIEENQSALDTLAEIEEILSRIEIDEEVEEMIATGVIKIGDSSYIV